MKTTLQLRKYYYGLIDGRITNLTAAKTTEDGYTLIQEPYFFAYNKDAKDEDGFAAPIRFLWNCRIRQILKRDIISEKKRTWKHAIRRLSFCVSKAMHRM